MFSKSKQMDLENIYTQDISSTSPDEFIQWGVFFIAFIFFKVKSSSQLNRW